MTTTKNKKTTKKMWVLPLEYNCTSYVRVVAPTSDEAWEEMNKADLDLFDYMDGSRGGWKSIDADVECEGETTEPVGLAKDQD